MRVGKRIPAIIPLLCAILLLTARDAAAGSAYITVEELANRLGMTCQNDVTTYRQTLTDGANEVVICPGMFNVLVNDKLVVMKERASSQHGKVVVPEDLFGVIRSHLGGRGGPGAIVAGSPLVTTRPKIVIDPGHGGKDPGAIGAGGVKEKDVNLRIGLKLRDILREKGYDVAMTREDDTFVPLDERAAIANREGADLCISIHANAARERSAHGYETYFVDDRGAYSATARGISSARYSVPSVKVLGTDAPLTSITKGVLYGALFEQYRLESRDLAVSVQSTLGTILHTPNRGAHGDKGLRVLRYSRCPAVLVEVGFLTNPSEAAQLRSSTHCDRLATVIALAVERYFTEVNATAWFTR